MIFAILMIPASYKYGSVLFLLTLFLLRGLVTVLPLFEGYLITHNHQEIQMNAEAENTKEKNSEKTIEIKEFTSHFYTDYISYSKYALVAKATAPSNCPFEKDVFLSIDTPPPKMIN